MSQPVSCQQLVTYVTCMCDGFKMLVLPLLRRSILTGTCISMFEHIYCNTYALSNALTTLAVTVRVFQPSRADTSSHSCCKCLPSRHHMTMCRDPSCPQLRHQVLQAGARILSHAALCGLDKRQICQDPNIEERDAHDCRGYRWVRATL